MKTKSNLKTVRLSQREIEQMEEFLAQNPAIENYSALARIAVLDFISKRGSIPVKPILCEEPRERPSFLWDYDLTEGEIREMLNGPLEKRRWLVGRILEHAKFDEIWKYLTPEEIGRDLPYVRLPEKTKRHWAYALGRWKKAS